MATETLNQSETKKGAGKKSRSSALLGVRELAHRMAWRYKKSSDPHHSDTYTFNDATVEQFARKLIEQHQGWQPIETAPRDGTKIDVYHGGNVRSVRWTDSNKPEIFRWFIDGAGFIENPEAWRPHVTPNA